MDEEWTIAQGSTGEVWASPGGVVIRRNGARTRLRFGKEPEIRIPADSIGAVQFKPAGLAAGWIRFVMKPDSDSRHASMTAEQSSVEFNAQQQPGFEGIRDIVQSALGIQRHPAGPTDSAWSHTSTVDVAAEIKELSRLRNEGRLSEAEFNQRKRELLGGG
jgi:hypothetical protein